MLPFHDDFEQWNVIYSMLQIVGLMSAQNWSTKVPDDCFGFKKYVSST